MLKVCVRHKADDCIKRKGWFHSFDSVGVVEKNSLESQNEITYKYHDSIGHQKVQRILFPVHALAIDSAQFVDSVVNTVENRIRKRLFISRDMIHVSTHRYYQYHIYRQRDKYL